MPDHHHDIHPALRMARATATLMTLGHSYALQCYAAMLRPRHPGEAPPDCPETRDRARRDDDRRVEEGFDNLPV